jgi:hypothetical protein
MLQYLKQFQYLNNEEEDNDFELDLENIDEDFDEKEFETEEVDLNSKLSEFKNRLFYTHSPINGNQFFYY